MLFSRAFLFLAHVYTYRFLTRFEEECSNTDRTHDDEITVCLSYQRCFEEFMAYHACHFNRSNRWWRWVTSVKVVVLGIGWVGKDYDLGGEGRDDDDLSGAGISTLFSLLIIGHVLGV
ncbi:hypothetical protein V3481_004680 [Fusarium oxysporum f. sp. vasinfectum]